MSQIFDQIYRLPIATLAFCVGVVLIIGVIAAVTTRLRFLLARGATLAPVAKPFLTNREYAMLAALEQVLPMYRIHAQVSMGALLAPAPRPGRRTLPSDRNAFAQKIVDFVIVDPTVGKVVALLELDDRWHDADKDRARDAMTARAGYQTIRVPASAKPTIQTAEAAVGHLKNAASPAASVVTRLAPPRQRLRLEERSNGV
ncbi:DUF2726 domain-containing protein [Sphingobium sp. B12D2B]|uniref:DUF2726 domain-containing protein n=1 Tax=Sphingobium sp. B12D2B TaxID=2940577 RepID=UPI0022248C59|nr:DUF2726 domain-containing protein [Sphingobium sp. B12D2B]MCW2351747.1 hypothetical protein [Sphingobium sp. B12D2B]